MKNDARISAWLNLVIGHCWAAACWVSPGWFPAMAALASFLIAAVSLYEGGKRGRFGSDKPAA
jgi:hypothetical protein